MSSSKIQMVQDLTKELAYVDAETEKLELLARQTEQQARAIRSRHTVLASMIQQLRSEWGIEGVAGEVETLQDGTLRFMPK